MHFVANQPWDKQRPANSLNLFMNYKTGTRIYVPIYVGTVFI